MLKDEIEKARKQGWNSAVKVGEYLLSRNDVDTSKTNKNLYECMDYIASEAKKVSYCQVAVVEDEDVYGWAVHYYDEDNLEFRKVSYTNNEENPKSKSKDKKTTKKQPKNNQKAPQKKPNKKEEDSFEQISLW